MTVENERFREAYRHASALVLGASGFIGRWVARALTAAGSDLTLVVRSASLMQGMMRRWEISGRVIECDVRDDAAVERLLHGGSPDVVFNLAGYGVDRSEEDEATAFALNRDLVSRLADLVSALPPPDRWRGVRLVHVGSALEYGAVRGTAQESGSVSPHTLYGYSKLAGTLALAAKAREQGLPAVTARLFTVFGAGEHEGRLWPTLVAASRSGGEVSLSAGTQRRDFAYVEDVAEGLLRLGAADARAGECVNLATGRLRSVREFAETAAMALGIDTERLVFGRESIRADEMTIDGVSTVRLRQLTGWVPSDDLEHGTVRACALEKMIVASDPTAIDDATGT